MYKNINQKGIRYMQHGSSLVVEFNKKEYKIKKENLIFVLIKMGYDKKEILKEIEETKDIKSLLKKYYLYDKTFLTNVNEVV